MKNLLTHGRNLAALVLLAAGGPVLAQSLGQPAGELWMGQPLQVTIPARFQSGDSRDTCVDAEVSYGETRLAPASVRTTVLGEGETRRVRVASDVVVDEPLVTVTLRAGCAGTVTRSYTLLPDMPSEAVLARLMQAAPVQALAAPAAPGPTLVAARAEAAPAALRLTPAVVRTNPAAQRLRTAKLSVAAAVALPRLRLDAVEADARSLLRVSASLSPPGDAAVRARSAMLWRAISADPQELVRGTAALQQLENELAQLRQSAGSTRSEMASLRQRIDEAQPWYLSPRLVQVLALLVLATGAGVALFAWRTRRAGEAVPWYQPSDRAALQPQPAEAPASPPSVPAPVAAQRTAGAFTPPAAAAAPAWPATAPARAVAELEPLAFDLGEADTPTARTQGPSSGLLRVETLAAILEEVEFLASLGLHSDATDVLKGYLEDSGSPAPVAFFELMRVCSLAEDPQAVEAVRRRYTKVHGVPAPTLAQVSAAGGLEQQRALAERITRAWGSADILPVIEQALFGLPPPDAPLPVQAARDLICLYDVAMVLASDAGGDRHEPADAPLAPWAHAEHLGEAQAYAQAVAEDAGGHRFALDIDLTVVPETLPEQQPEPDPRELAARLQAEKDAARRAAERAAREAEDAFNAAVASERAPISRY